MSNEDRPSMPDLPRNSIEPGRTTGRPEAGDRAFVWGVWAVMAVGAVAFVARFRTDVPVWDDYIIIPALVGSQPVTPGWLWEQTNEHRIAVPKLLLLAAGRVAGGDIRVGMFLSVAAMAGLAALLIATAGRLPGRSLPSDAFFAVLLLHPGHAANFLWSFQFVPILPTVLATAFLAPIAGRPTWPGVRMAALAGIGLVLLPLSGGNGVVFVPPMACWLIASGWAEGRSGRPGRGWRAPAIVLAAVPGLAVTAAYFRGFRAVPHPEAAGGALDGVRAAIQFLACGLGFPASWAWPWSGAATLGLIALTVAWLARAWATRPEERPRLVGLAAFLAGVLGLAGAVGWGRGWAGDRAGFADRYIAMATPIWCWLALAIRLYAPPAPGRFVANALFAVITVLAWPNAEAGLRYGREGLTNAEALDRDIRAGEPPYRIAREHTPYLHPRQDDVIRLLPILRKARIGPFGALADDPPFRETPLPPAPVELRMARWEGTTARVTNVDPQVTFAVDPPRYVAGIRIKYSHENPQGAPARFVATWKGPGQAGYAEDRRHADWYLPTGPARETTIWVDGVIDRFRIQPDNRPCDFRFDEISLLEPAHRGADSGTPGRIP